MSDPKIHIRKNGAYRVSGNLALVRKVQISSEHGEPLTWQKTVVLETDPVYILCRCGLSNDKPFCDKSHKNSDFDGTETAATNTFEERKIVYEGSTNISIKRDYSICAESGFCGNRLADIEKLVERTDDSIVRAQVIAMIERCPSGSYTYALSDESEDIEPDYPQQIAVTTETTSEGPIAGPLWVTGYVSILRADGQPMERRNRIALCRCGHSKNKPLCDGTHRALHITE